jgi:poly-gamma-glutamate synthesis protein (capsule biosynthesis protein)
MKRILIFTLIATLLLSGVSFSYGADNIAVKPQKAKLSFVGDCTLGGQFGGYTFTQTYNKKGAAYFFSGVKKVFKNDDLTIANLECALTNSNSYIPKGYSPAYYYKGKPGYTKILKKGSVEVVNLANNHTMDYGQSGYNDTTAALKKAKISYFDRTKVLVRKVNGIKIGFFGIAFTDSRTIIKARIKTLKKKKVDVIICTMHDGPAVTTYTTTARQKNAAKIAIDSGADAVVGHHPHVLQNMTKYKGKIIAYSLGNFCYGGNMNPADKDTAILQLNITKKGKKITIKKEVLPASLSSSTNKNDFRPRLLKGKAAQRVLKKLNIA